MAEEDPKIVARNERSSPEAERMLRQFLNTDGPKGNSKNYDKGYEFAFKWSDERKLRLLSVMEDMGCSFEKAYDLVVSADAVDAAVGEAANRGD